MINVGIIGCEGKLGKEIIDSISEKENCEVVRAIGSQSLGKKLSYNFKEVLIENDLMLCTDCDILIDATNRNAFINENYCKYEILKKPIIIATTGFNNADEIKIKELAKIIPIVKSPNFSFELFYFIEALKNYVRVMRNIDVTIIEKHHKAKLDIPSGTALIIKDSLMQANSSLNISIESIRAGRIHGEHSVFITNYSGEEITFTHKVTSRRVFVDGIIKIIFMLRNMENGLYTLADFCFD